jgi:hypothetical protein
VWWLLSVAGFVFNLHRIPEGSDHGLQYPESSVPPGERAGKINQHTINLKTHLGSDQNREQRQISHPSETGHPGLWRPWGWSGPAVNGPWIEESLSSHHEAAALLEVTDDGHKSLWTLAFSSPSIILGTLMQHDVMCFPLL